jgi:hypothetical protein
MFLPLCTSHPHSMFLPLAKQGHGTITVIAVIIAIAQLHLVLMAVSIPVMICIPNGCLSSAGYVHTISDGLRYNSVFATTLWGSGMTWITAIRYIGVVGTSPLYAFIAHLSIVVTTYASFLTIRYDVVEMHHVVFAIVWIISSFIFHFSTTVQGVANQSSVASYILAIGVVLGVVFVSLFTDVELKQGPPGEIVSIEILSTISVLEVLTVLSIMSLDFLQSLYAITECQVHWG